MKLNELRARRALAAREALAGGLGLLRRFRTPLAKMAVEWRAQQKKIGLALDRYEATLENDPDWLGRPILPSASKLMGELDGALKDEVKELSSVWADLLDHEKMFRKRKPTLTRLEKAERAAARKAAKGAK